MLRCNMSATVCFQRHRCLPRKLPTIIERQLLVVVGKLGCLELSVRERAWETAASLEFSIQQVFFRLLQLPCEDWLRSTASMAAFTARTCLFLEKACICGRHCWRAG